MSIRYRCGLPGFRTKRSFGLRAPRPGSSSLSIATTENWCFAAGCRLPQVSCICVSSRMCRKKWRHMHCGSSKMVSLSKGASLPRTAAEPGSFYFAALGNRIGL